MKPLKNNSDTRPEFIQKYEVGKGEVLYGTQKILYTVLSKELEPELSGFMGYLGGEHLFISEEVPEAYRLPQLIHEIVEFTTLKGQSGRCLLALQEELKHVPDEIRDDYLQYRKNFFANLIRYYENSSDEEFKQEIQASYEFLVSMTENYHS